MRKPIIEVTSAPGNGQCDGAAYAAADNADLLKAVYMRWYAERAYEVVQTFPFV